MAAIRGLGRLDDAQAQAVLADVLKDRSELIRAEAVTAIAIRGSRAVVLGAAADPSWRVRLQVAVALAGYGYRDGVSTARRLLDDPMPRSSGRSCDRWRPGPGQRPVLCSWMPWARTPLPSARWLPSSLPCVALRRPVSFRCAAGPQG